jgi:capsular polysaccharide transport system ATP-binding protein
MIIFEHVTQFLGTHSGRRTVLADASISIPSNRRIALLGTSDEDNKVVVDLLTGVLTPHAGHVGRRAKVSFPAGEIRPFAGELSVRSNVMHVARLYGVDVQDVVNFVERVADMGASFDRPYGALPRAVRRQLSQIVAYCLPFDVYVLNELGRGGTQSLTTVIEALFEARARSCGIIVPTRDIQLARRFCDAGLLLHGRQIFLFDELERAIVALTKLSIQ